MAVVDLCLLICKISYIFYFFLLNLDVGVLFCVESHDLCFFFLFFFLIGVYF